MSLFRIKAKRRENEETRPTKKTIATNVFMILLLLGSMMAVPIFEAKLVAGAPPDINIEPKAPTEGVQKSAETVGGWIFWGAWFLIFVVGAVGVFLMLTNRKQLGLTLFILAILGAIILANWFGLIKSIAG
ncbi:membrane protein of unknown function (plasmid) [Thermococcus nautili]|uniref:hypothetical protein n=1 Tax=Thermococcus nautili TaxID=195522 RepID=UPI0025565019|nr:hypothetical protein [Thermococcus nautili]CAI1494133.1 membrane protein of unknown function [Thermococcus nautili]